MKSSLSTSQRLASGLIILSLTVYFLILAKFLLAPLAFAALFAIMLQPIAGFLERILTNRLISIFITFIIALIPLAGIIVLFSYQFANIMDSLPDIAGKIKAGVNVIFDWLEENTTLSPEERTSWVQKKHFQLIGCSHRVY
jgi:predicted PurR-regulated permease PerM